MRHLLRTLLSIAVLALCTCRTVPVGIIPTVLWKAVNAPDAAFSDSQSQRDHALIPTESLRVTPYLGILDLVGLRQDLIHLSSQQVHFQRLRQ